MYTKDEFKEEDTKTSDQPVIVNNTKNEALELVEKFLDNDEDKKKVISIYLKRSKTKIKD